VTHPSPRCAPRLLPLLLAASCAPAAGGTTGDPGDLAPLLEDCRRVAPASEGVSAAGRSARFGHLGLELLSGAVFPLRTPRGEVLGFFFQGRGRYRYRSDDPFDRLTLEANLAGRPRAPSLVESTIGDDFDRMVVFFARPALQEIWGPRDDPPPRDPPPGGRPPVLDDASRGAFETIWNRMTGPGNLGFDHLVAETRLNEGDLQYLEAEIEGRAEPIGYHYERLQDAQENLFRYRDLPAYDARLIQPISRQPLAPGGTALPPPLLLSDARIAVRSADNRSAAITSDLTFASMRDGLRVVRLGLMSHRSPGSLNWAAPERRLRVTGVFDSEGRPLPFSHRYKEVLVVLPVPVRRGELFRLRFETEGDILTGAGGSEAEFSVLRDPWFPQPFCWGCTRFTFDLRVTTRNPYVPVAVGTVTSLGREGDSWSLEARSEVPVRGLALVAGAYSRRQEGGGPVPVRFSLLARRHDVGLDAVPRLAAVLLRWYTEALGPYPFDRLDVVDSPEEGPGSAPPGIAILDLGRDSGSPAADRPDRTAAEVAEMLAHQIAHQWFWHRVMPASTRDTWLSESLARYFAGLALDAARPDGSPVSLPRLVADWRNAALACRDGAPIEAASSLSGERGEKLGRCLLEARGPLVLHMLRGYSGETGFVAIVRRLIERAGSGLITTDDFERSAEEITRKDLGWFFDQWYRAGGVPEVRLSAVAGEEGGAPFLEGRAEQPGGGLFKRLRIPLVVDYAGGPSGTFLVDQDRPSIGFRIALAGRPRRIRVDPDHVNLAVYRPSILRPGRAALSRPRDGAERAGHPSGN
jgi:hypothetical protein